MQRELHLVLRLVLQDPAALRVTPHCLQLPTAEPQSKCVSIVLKRLPEIKKCRNAPDRRKCRGIRYVDQLAPYDKMISAVEVINHGAIAEAAGCRIKRGGASTSVGKKLQYCGAIDSAGQLVD